MSGIGRRGKAPRGPAARGRSLHLYMSSVNPAVWLTPLQSPLRPLDDGPGNTGNELFFYLGPGFPLGDVSYEAKYQSYKLVRLIHMLGDTPHHPLRIVIDLLREPPDGHESFQERLVHLLAGLHAQPVPDVAETVIRRERGHKLE